MYKLFLCLRYLRRGVMAYFAIMGMAICVFMIVVAVSVMNGFLRKVELSAKGLFGDIIIEPARGHQGLSHYDEILHAVGQRVEEVVDDDGNVLGTPMILSYGVLQIPGESQIRLAVSVAGIRLPERARVTDFSSGLFVQRGMHPTFDPPKELMIRRVNEEIASTRRIQQEILERMEEQGKAPELLNLLDRLGAGLYYQNLGLQNIMDNERLTRYLENAMDSRDRAYEQGLDASGIEDEIQSLRSRVIEPVKNRVILGLGIPSLSFRTDDGKTVRYMVPGSKVVLNIFPLGRRMTMTNLSPNIEMFTVVDDNRSDVSSIDNDMVYVPFETLQLLNNMDNPLRCSQIHLKVRNGLDKEPHLSEVAAKVERAWLEYRKQRRQGLRNTLATALADDNRLLAPINAEAPFDEDMLDGLLSRPEELRRILKDPDDIIAEADDIAFMSDLNVQTWRQRQDSIVSHIESQRTLVVIMFIIISMVSVVLLFVIFYMIVAQKTREIGVLKAVGASSGGVAGIFLAYGLAVGVVGAVLGTIGGWYFVDRINPIHDWVAATFGFQVWSRKSFLFEHIPNTVDPWDVVMIIAGTIVAGLVGALLPAIRAARMQPVEALRYE